MREVGKERVRVKEEDDEDRNGEVDSGIIVVVGASEVAEEERPGGCEVAPEA